MSARTTRFLALAGFLCLPFLPPSSRADRAEPSLTDRLQALAASDRLGADPDRAAEARGLLGRAADAAATMDAGRRRELAEAAALLTHRLLVRRIDPRDDGRKFTVWGRGDRDGNTTLRDDLAAYARDAAVLRRIAGDDTTPQAAAFQLEDVRLLAEFRRYIVGRWPVSDATRRRFDQTRDDMLAALPADAAERLKASGRDWDRLADDSHDAPSAKRDAPVSAEARPDNPYLHKVDEAIADPVVRRRLRAAQPACVRLDLGSGVNLAPEGRVLTAAHVPGRLGAKSKVRFPDGRTFDGTCTAIDHFLDLAILTLSAADDLPFAPLAPAAPEVGDRVVCIGQPGEWTPEGKPTGYKPFHVSTGVVRGVAGDPLGGQSLGRLKHDAWTYWGHSGSPLFNEAGQLVAIHNSWDAATAMRRAVPYQAVAQFLAANKIDYTSAK